MADVVQQLSKILGIEWDLHTPWSPQLSGKVQKINQALERQISKICQETSLKWSQALPLALLKIRIQPRSRSIWKTVCSTTDSRGDTCKREDGFKVISDLSRKGPCSSEPLGRL